MDERTIATTIHHLHTTHYTHEAGTRLASKTFLGQKCGETLACQSENVAGLEIVFVGFGVIGDYCQTMAKFLAKGPQGIWRKYGGGGRIGREYGAQHSERCRRT